MKKFVLFGAAAAAFVATPALAQQAGGNAGQGVTRAQVETQVRTMFARLDADRDGFVTQAEAQAARGAGRAERLENRAERREARFARLDTNRDGSISRDEFFAKRERAQRGDRAERREARTERRAERRAARMEGRGQRGGLMARLGGKRFQRIDTNRDGRISLAELTTRRLQAFDRADANRDGRVTREERRAVRADRQARRG